MRKIKLTPTEIVKVQDETGWTPDVFELSHGVIRIPGPPDDYYWDDGNLPCGCCSCCGCDCDYYPDDEDYVSDDYDEEDE